MPFWRMGNLRDASDPAESAQLALATLPCPAAWIGRAGPTAVGIAARELAHACSVLGHETPVTLHEDVERLADERVHDGELIQVAVVPDGPPPVAAVGTWPLTRVVGWRATSTAPLVLRAVVAPWPLNERSPATSLRLTTRAETAAGRRHAAARGADAAVWLGLTGAVARIDDWSLVVLVDGERLTPPPSDGAPVDGWTDRLVESGVVRRQAVPSLDGAAGLAAVAPWGVAVPVILDPRQADSSVSLCDGLTEALT